MKAQSPNHWTTKESPGLKVFNPHVSFGSSGLWQSSRLSLLLIILAAEESFCRMPLVGIWCLSPDFPGVVGRLSCLMPRCFSCVEHFLSMCSASAVLTVPPTTSPHPHNTWQQPDPIVSPFHRLGSEAQPGPVTQLRPTAGQRCGSDVHPRFRENLLGQLPHQRLLIVTWHCPFFPQGLWALALNCINFRCSFRMVHWRSTALLGGLSNLEHVEGWSKAGSLELCWKERLGTADTEQW